ncbi:unnamed protein product [Rotaria sordida]|uniref:Uncharacterized protein n=1 Tax=Rotaria sordida TaxID=392033 RepID=A0A813XF00_9BILA|nr:unnamed protein product [Rotaria sordida]
MEYLNANRWERLILTHMLNLCIFDFEHQYRTWFYNDDRQVYEAQINMFNSLFWIERQWFFENQYYRIRYSNIATLYSTNPYRFKQKKIGSYDLDTKENPVHHVCIHSTNVMEKFVDNFRNVTELTLFDTFDVSCDSIVRSLNRIIPLKQLSTLSLDCHRFPFDQVIELLNSILFYRADSISIQQKSTLEKIQLLVALFSRLEYFTINLYQKDLETIAKFLLSKFNNNSRHLSSLCISKQRRDLIEKLRILIEIEKLPDDFTIKFINRKLYLWW